MHAALLTMSLAALAQLSNAIVITSRDAPLYYSGTISVDLSVQTDNYTIQITARDSLSYAINNAPIPTTDQSATCNIIQLAGSQGGCSSPAWSWAYNGGAASITHRVKYQSTSSQDGNTGKVTDTDAPNYQRREASQISLSTETSNGAGPSKDHPVCENSYGAPETGYQDSQYDFIQGRGRFNQDCSSYKPQMAVTSLAPMPDATPPSTGP